MKPLKVLFLCTGNSCRSQMAEGWANHLFPEEVEAYSAGTHPAGVNPTAIRVMAEAGVDISHHTSKSLFAFQNREFDLVITLCSSARRECPNFPGATRLLHRSFPDPALKPQDLDAFRRIRDQIKDFLIQLISQELKKAREAD